MRGTSLLSLLPDPLWPGGVAFAEGKYSPPPHEYPGYDTKQSEVPVMLELWRMRSTPSLPSFPGPLWPEVVAPDTVLSMGQIELFDI